MALPSTYVQATLRYGGTDRPLQLNVVWYTLTGTVGGANPQEDAQTIADAIMPVFDSALSNVMNEEIELHGVDVSYNTAGNVFTATSPFTSATGTLEDDTLPSYASVVIQKRTGTGGRSGRGRWYIGCVPESLTDSSELTPVGLPAYDSLAAQFLVQPTAGGATLQPQHYSVKDNNMYPIITTKAITNLATQRRRKQRPFL